MNKWESDRKKPVSDRKSLDIYMDSGKTQTEIMNISHRTVYGFVQNDFEPNDKSGKMGRKPDLDAKKTLKALETNRKLIFR
jgi:hypothetical protein